MSAEMSNQVTVGNHQATTVVLRNSSSASCSLSGYATLTLTTGTGSLPTSQTDGSDGLSSVPSTPGSVEVAAGGFASFVVQYTTTPSGTESCPQASWLDVILPKDTAKAVVTTDIAPCGGQLFVGPFQSGTVTP